MIGEGTQLSVQNTIQHLQSMMRLPTAFIYFYLFSILDRGEGREQDREGNMLVAFPMHSDRGANPELGMCADWELNPRPFPLQDNAQATEPPWPGPHCIYLNTSAHPSSRWLGFFLLKQSRLIQLKNLL